MGWVAHFDNSDWEISSLGTWDTDHWDSELFGSDYWVLLGDIGTWASAYRPTKIRVTFTGQTTLVLTLADGLGGETDLVSDEAATSGEEFEITWGEGDIATLNFQTDAGNFVITNIEFYETPTINWSHKFNNISTFTKLNGLSALEKINSID